MGWYQLERGLLGTRRLSIVCRIAIRPIGALTHLRQEEVAEIMSDRPPTCAWEPVFCLETALKAFYYSLIVYDYNGIDGLRPVRSSRLVGRGLCAMVDTHDRTASRELASEHRTHSHIPILTDKRRGR